MNLDVRSALHTSTKIFQSGGGRLTKRARRLGVAALTLSMLLVMFGAYQASAETTFTVNTVDDLNDGACNATHCSLREAIIAANAATGTDVIAFNIAGPGPHSIKLSSSLPTVTGPAIIDGTTEPDFAGSPIVEIDGSLLTFPSSFAGLQISAGSSTVRGLVLNRFNSPVSAIYLTTKGGNSIKGNFIGTDVTGTLAGAPTKGQIGIRVEGAPGNIIGGTSAVDRNIISGNNIGIFIRFSSSGGNVIQGNFIGTDVTGTKAIGNGGSGIDIDTASDNVIGGTANGARNIISANDSVGLRIQQNSDRNLIQGNYVGTDVTGTVRLNNQFGIAISNSNDNTIGGTTPGARNVISGNSSTGLNIGGNNRGALRNIVQGNFIGTNASGTAALGNNQRGIELSFMVSQTLIGGTTPEARNIISGNGESGVFIVFDNTTNNSVQGNFIGTDVNGTAAIANSFAGVLINTAPSNTIGGTAAGAGNLISGNGTGVFIFGKGATGNLVQGNLIGTDPSGGPLGNRDHGVQISDTDPINATNLATNNLVGGTASGAGNVIAFNGKDGVFVPRGTGHGILANSIFSNLGLGIDLGPDGVTPNDPLDVDTGANKLQNFPVLVAVNSGAGTAVDGTLNSEPNTTYRLEFFSSSACDPSGNGEGKTFLGAESVTTDALGSATFSTTFPVALFSGQVVTSTATDPGNNTSEFSKCQAVAGAPDPDRDGDGVNDNVDNCPDVANVDQADKDGDKIGDACDPQDNRDNDNDGVQNFQDNCPNAANPDQQDTDMDGLGDACDNFDDRDTDGDGVKNGADNCPGISNPDQADTDKDGIGDACDPQDNRDNDNDGVQNFQDNCPNAANPDQQDTDMDGLGDACDNFDDRDTDGDGVKNGADNCPLNANPDQRDTDKDGMGDACDADDDNDGAPDGADNCPLNANPDQADGDGDGIGNACDPNPNDGPRGDLDRDGVANGVDNCPLNANPDQRDTDKDGIGDACDPKTGPPTSKDQCKENGWMVFNNPSFKNQGDCVSYVNGRR